MALKDIGEEINKIANIEARTSSLRTKMEEYLALYNLEPFEMPKIEGKWENLTTNRPRVEGDNLINDLGHAARKVYIPIDDDDVSGRGKLTKTEDCVNGFIYSADSLYDGVPEITLNQGCKAFYRVVRGFSSDRVYLYEDDDGNVICDLAVWDPYNTFWVSGKRGLLWVAYRRYDTEEGVKSDYKGWNGKANEDGFVEIYNVLDCSDKGENAEEGVFIGTDWVMDPEDIGLDYIPVRIKAGASMPLVIDGKSSESIKYLGGSWFAGKSEFYKAESKLLSYNMTRAKRMAKETLIQEYDSAKDPQPPQHETDPREAGGITNQDVNKGQNLSAAHLMTQGQDINNMLGLVQQKAAEAGLPALGLGIPPFPSTAQATDQIHHSIRSKEYPFIISMQADYEWIASEIASQYKNGGFVGATTFEGVNSRLKRFRSKIKPDEIVDDRHFKCELIPDIIRDRNLHSGMAIAEVGAGLISRQTALDVHQLVEDPDHELEIIAREKSNELAEVQAWSTVVALIKDAGNKRDPASQLKRLQADIIIRKLMSMMQQEQAQGQPPGGGAPQAGVSRPMPPQAMAGAQRNTRPPQTPPEVRDAARARGKVNVVP